MKKKDENTTLEKGFYCFSKRFYNDKKYFFGGYFCLAPLVAYCSDNQLGKATVTIKRLT